MRKIKVLQVTESLGGRCGSVWLVVKFAMEDQVVGMCFLGEMLVLPIAAFNGVNILRFIVKI